MFISIQFLYGSSSILFGQEDSIRAKSIILEELKSVQINSLTLSGVDDLIEKITSLNKYTSALPSQVKQLIDSAVNFRNRIIHVKASETPIDYGLLRAYPEKYLGKEVVIEGIVTDVSDYAVNKVKVKVSDFFDCELGAYQSLNSKSMETGDSILIKGYVRLISKIIYLKNCSIYTYADLSTEVSRLEEALTALLDSTIYILKDDIKKQKFAVGVKLYSEAHALFGKASYAKALEKFEILKQYPQLFDNLSRSRIDSALHFLTYQNAEEFYKKELYLQAVEKYDSLVQINNFNNSRKYASIALANYFNGVFQQYKKINTIDGYINLFTELTKQRYRESYSRVVDSLFSDYKSSIQVAVKSLLIGKVDDYVVIPKGSFLYSNIYDISVPEMVIRPQPVSKNELMLYTIMNGKPNLTARSINELKIAVGKDFEAWLGVKFINDIEREFIAADGWTSIDEKNKYTDASVNYGVSATEYTLKLEDASQINNLRTKVAGVHSKLSQNIIKQKNRAYLSGRVTHWPRFVLTPHFSLNYSSIEINNYKGNVSLTSIPMQTYTEKYSFELISADIGIHFGFPNDPDISGEDTSYTAAGLNISYLFGITNFAKNAPSSIHVLPDFLLKGPEAELIYYGGAQSSALLFNGTMSLGAGVARYGATIKYNDKLSTDRLYFATLSTNVACFFIKGYYSLSKTSFGSSIYGFNTGIRIGLPIQLSAKDI